MLNESTVIFNEITSIIPNISNNFKRLLHVNPGVLQRRHSSCDVPSIEVSPPSPSTADRASPFIDIEINKVISDTLDVCKSKLRRFSEPCFGTYFDVSTANSSIGDSQITTMSIPGQYLLKVPASSGRRKHHRRRSLPSNYKNTGEEKSNWSTDNGKSGSRRSRSYEEIYYYQQLGGVQKRVHEIYISGYGKGAANKNEGAIEHPSSNSIWKENHSTGESGIFISNNVPHCYGYIEKKKSFVEFKTDNEKALLYRTVNCNRLLEHKQSCIYCNCNVTQNNISHSKRNATPCRYANNYIKDSESFSSNPVTQEFRYEMNNNGNNVNNEHIYETTTNNIKTNNNEFMSGCFLIDHNKNDSTNNCEQKHSGCCDVFNENQLQ